MLGVKGKTPFYTWGTVAENGKILVDGNVVGNAGNNAQMGNTVAALIEGEDCTYVAKLSDRKVDVAVTKDSSGVIRHTGGQISSFYGMKEVMYRGNCTMYFKCPEDISLIGLNGAIYIPQECVTMCLSIVPEPGVTFIAYGVPQNGEVLLAGGLTVPYQGFMSADTDSLFAVNQDGVKSLGLGMTVGSTQLTRAGNDCFYVSGTDIEVYVDDLDADTIMAQVPTEVLDVQGKVVYFPYGMDGTTFYRKAEISNKQKQTGTSGSSVEKAAMELATDTKLCEELSPVVEALLAKLPPALASNGNILATIINLAASLSGAEIKEEEPVRSADALPSDIL